MIATYACNNGSTLVVQSDPGTTNEQVQAAIQAYCSTGSSAKAEAAASAVGQKRAEWYRLPTSERHWTAHQDVHYGHSTPTAAVNPSAYFAGYVAVAFFHHGFHYVCACNDYRRKLSYD